jgi:hypothetical protein
MSGSKRQSAYRKSVVEEYVCGYPEPEDGDCVAQGAYDDPFSLHVIILRTRAHSLRFATSCLGSPGESRGKYLRD